MSDTTANGTVRSRSRAMEFVRDIAAIAACIAVAAFAAWFFLGANDDEASFLQPDRVTQMLNLDAP